MPTPRITEEFTIKLIDIPHASDHPAIAKAAAFVTGVIDARAHGQRFLNADHEQKNGGEFAHGDVRAMEAVNAILAGRNISSIGLDNAQNVTEYRLREDVLRKVQHEGMHRLGVANSQAGSELAAILEPEVRVLQDRIHDAIAMVVTLSEELDGYDKAATAKGYQLPPISGYLTLPDMGVSESLDVLRNFLGHNARTAAERQKWFADPDAARIGRSHARATAARAADHAARVANQAEKEQAMREAARVQDASRIARFKAMFTRR